MVFSCDTQLTVVGKALRRRMFSMQRSYGNSIESSAGAIARLRKVRDKNQRRERGGHNGFPADHKDAIVAPVRTARAQRLVVHLAGVRPVVLAAILHIACSAPNPPHCAAAVVALGRTLFFDTGLSGDGKVACATCHKPARAYTDGLARASGIAGRQGTRNTPSLLDAGRQRSKLGVFRVPCRPAIPEARAR